MKATNAVYGLILAASILLAAATAGLSFESLRKAAYAKVAGRDAFSSLAESATPDEEPFAWIEDTIDDFRRCGRSSSVAAVTFALRRFASLNPADDYDAWEAALAQADRAVALSLRCAPTNGLRWAQLAVLERSAASLPARIKPLLEMSQRMAPADGDAIVLRLSGWWSLPREFVVDSAVRRADTRLFLANTDPQKVVSLLHMAPAWVNDEAKTLIGTEIPERRRQHLKAAGIFAVDADQPKRGGLLDMLLGPSPFRR